MTPYHVSKRATVRDRAGRPVAGRHSLLRSTRISKSGTGFALLIAVIFMAVMLTFGLALGSLAYKQEVIASSAAESQYAFYAADAALECVLYEDQQYNLFKYDTTDPPPTLDCDGKAPYQGPTRTFSGSRQILSYQMELDYGSLKRCADVTIYKPSAIGTSYLFAQGYDVSCATVDSANSTTRFVARGLEAHY